MDDDGRVRVPGHRFKQQLGRIGHDARTTAEGLSSFTERFGRAVDQLDAAIAEGGGGPGRSVGGDGIVDVLRQAELDLGHAVESLGQAAEAARRLVSEW